MLASLIDALAPGNESEVAVGVRGELLHRFGGPFDHAIALLRDTPRRQLALLGRPDASRGVAELARALAPDGDPRVAEVEDRLSTAGMASLVLAAELAEPAARLLEAGRATLARARPAVEAATRDGARATREIQRSGLLGEAELVGDLFGPLVVADALARAGEGASRLLLEILERRETLTFYRGASMARDADDAAAMILVARAHAATHPLVEEARGVLALARHDDGRIDTWVDLPGVETAAPAASWIGKECAGVAGRALAAMAVDAERFDDAAVASSAAWLAGLAGHDGTFEGAF